MDESRQQAVVSSLLRLYGQTFAKELEIDLAGNTPEALFRLLCAAVLFSAPIRYTSAMKAAKALSDKGWTSADKMLATSWSERTRTLNASGYARYDEKTSSMLGDDAKMLVERYGGDPRRLRDAAGRRPDRERALLKEFKGIGDVGVDIFFREVQVVWNELYPFLDARALASAERLGLKGDAVSLAQLVGRKTFARLAAALIRVQLGHAHQRVLEEAEAALAH